MKTLFTVLVLILSCGCAQAAELVRVIDGDTFIAKEKGKELKCRMAYIDAPELKQPYGLEIKEYLENQLSLYDFDLEILSRDFYGRSLVVVHHGALNINRWMVIRGRAWIYKNKKLPKEFQEIAQKEKVGLWQEDSPVSPWEWRKARKKK